MVCFAVGCLARLGQVEPVPPEVLRSTPDRIARGEYLVEHVTVCLDCHSQRDWDRFSAPIVPGSEGQGGEVFDERHGVRGVVYGTNITPAGLAGWSDDELLRAITAGVNKLGDVLFPAMPYRSYRHLTRSDAAAIISYVRTLSPIEHQVPPRRLSFLVEFLIRSFAMDPVRLEQTIDEQDPLEYGRYLTRLANCADCHTPRTLSGEPEPNSHMSGGVGFTVPQGLVLSSNITPDAATGIGRWTREDFVSRFKSFLDPSRARTVSAGGMNTPMPWTMYAGMSETDLGAIYTYLRTVDPVRNRVAGFTSADDQTSR